MHLLTFLTLGTSASCFCFHFFSKSKAVFNGIVPIFKLITFLFPFKIQKTGVHPFFNYLHYTPSKIKSQIRLVSIQELIATLTYNKIKKQFYNNFFYFLYPVPAGISLPIITFSFSPRNLSSFPCTAALISTLAVS